MPHSTGSSVQAKKAKKNHSPVSSEDGAISKTKTASTGIMLLKQQRSAKMYSGGSMAVNEDDFIEYTNFRILDSIGYPGAYRKFMIRRKEQGAAWATKMNDHVLVVQHSIKELSILEQDIKKSSILKNLDIIWQHVVESNIPPSDQQLTIGTCLITGKTNLPCIVIRGKGRGANNFTVSSKFSLFLYHLWIIYKIDILIKVYTRKTLEELDPKNELLLSVIAEKFKERKKEVHSLARSLHAAYNHVYRSAIGGLMSVV